MSKWPWNRLAIGAFRNASLSRNAVGALNWRERTNAHIAITRSYIGLAWSSGRRTMVRDGCSMSERNWLSVARMKRAPGCAASAAAMQCRTIRS